MYTTPSLSLVTTSCEEIAMVTVARLIELVENGSVTPTDFVIHDVTLARRNSVRQIWHAPCLKAGGVPAIRQGPLRCGGKTEYSFIKTHGV